MYKTNRAIYATATFKSYILLGRAFWNEILRVNIYLIFYSNRLAFNSKKIINVAFVIKDN